MFNFKIDIEGWLPRQKEPWIFLKIFSSVLYIRYSCDSACSQLYTRNLSLTTSETVWDNRQIMDSFNKAKKQLEQESDIDIKVFLSSIRIQSNEFHGTDRRNMKRKTLTSQQTEFIYEKFSSLVCEDLKIRCRRLSDLYPRWFVSSLKQNFVYLRSLPVGSQRLP